MSKVPSNLWTEKIGTLLFLVCGLKLLITGEAGERAGFAVGSHVRVVGILFMLIGGGLAYTVLRKKGRFR